MRVPVRYRIADGLRVGGLQNGRFVAQDALGAGVDDRCRPRPVAGSGIDQRYEGHGSQGRRMADLTGGAPAMVVSIRCTQVGTCQVARNRRRGLMTLVRGAMSMRAVGADDLLGRGLVFEVDMRRLPERHGIADPATQWQDDKHEGEHEDAHRANDTNS